VLVFWVVTLCGLSARYPSLGETYCLIFWGILISVKQVGRWTVQFSIGLHIFLKCILAKFHWSWYSFIYRHNPTFWQKNKWAQLHPVLLLSLTSSVLIIPFTRILMNGYYGIYMTVSKEALYVGDPETVGLTWAWCSTITESIVNLGNSFGQSTFDRNAF
jgi:hypothetical protein